MLVSTPLRTRSALAPLIITNGITVSALYWAQAVVGQAAHEFGASFWVHLMPGATLVGYAIGVAILAGFAHDLTSPRDLGIHALLLTFGLCAAAATPNAAVAAAAFLLIGLGCSLTQRLLACATTAAGPGRQSQAIGWIIAAGLCGIILARALVPVASAWLGWRTMFWLAAGAIALCGMAATFAAFRIGPRDGSDGQDAIPTALALWRGKATLRRAALQQAMVFAAFNMAWAVYPRLLSGTHQTPALSMGIVAGLGAVAAIVSGRICVRRDPALVAATGCAAVMLASVALLAVRHPAGACSAGMAVLDIGTQLALVANQARAQALDLAPATRGRLAAIVTTVGFAGGAIGAAIGNVFG